MEKKLTINKKVELLIKILCTISAGFVSFMISLRYDHNYTLAGVFNSWLIMGAIMYYKVSIKKIDLKKLLISIYPALLLLGIVATRITSDNLQSFYPKYFTYSNHFAPDFFRLMGFPSLLFLVYCFVDKILPIIIDFFKSFDKVEKTFIIASSIAAFIGMYLLIDKTTAFSFPVYQGKYIQYDVIYTLDCTIDVFQNISSFANDIRNPLFGIMSLPFTVVAVFISKTIPFGRDGFTFASAISAIQVIVTALTIILLARILKIEEKNKYLFYALCLSTLPFLVFSIVIEQYIFSVFYLILFIYIYLESKRKRNFIYVASTGSILTSGLLFPLISKEKKFKKWVTDVFDCFLVFVTATILGGQLPQVFTATEKTSALLNSFSGKITEEVKLNRFTYFIKEIFFADPGDLAYVRGAPAYVSVDFGRISIIGVLLFILCLVSIYLNRKNKMAIISGIWLAFSVLLLYVIGWGAPENGYILYSYYFGWAYLSLYYLFWKKIFEKKPKIFNGTIITTIVLMLITNIPVFYKVLSFAVTYYK